MHMQYIAFTVFTALNITVYNIPLQRNRNCNLNHKVEISFKIVVIRRELCSRLPPPEILKMDLRGKTNYPKSVIIVIHIQQVQLYTCLYFKNFRLTEYHVRLAVVKNELLIKAAPALVSDKVATAVQCKACTGFRLILFSENIWDGYERGN